MITVRRPGSKMHSIGRLTRSPGQRGPSRPTKTPSGLLHLAQDAAAGLPANLRILVFAPHTAKVATRSGVQRVTTEMVRAMSELVAIDLVKWDVMAGQLRYFDAADFANFFARQRRPPQLKVHPAAHRVRYRFADTVPTGSRVLILFPEVAYHTPGGNEILARIIAECREYGWATAAVFYDLIPISNRHYIEFKADHERYAAELLRLDGVFAISEYSAAQLTDYFVRSLSQPPGALESARLRIGAVPLADARARHRDLDATPGQERNLILLLGTVEPRKQQVRVIKAFQRLRLFERAKLRLAIVGSLHPALAEEFTALVRSDTAIDYYGYASDAKIRELFGEALFSVFASNDEGFGLPISESLSYGVPCLTANFGSMQEIAARGGCVTVDVDDDDALDRGLLSLVLEPSLIARCRAEIAGRRFRTWHDYATELLASLADLHPADERYRLESRIRHAVAALLAKPARKNPAVDRLRVDGPSPELIRLSVVTPASVEHWRPEASGQDACAVPLDAIIFGRGSYALGRLPPAVLVGLFGADAWFGAERQLQDELARLAAETQYPGMLPACCGWASHPTELSGVVGTCLAGLVTRRARRTVTSRREALYQQACNQLVGQAPARLLTIVISTYNRQSFVAENVRWILLNLERFGGEIDLLVVDNASTDSTEQILRPFTANPLFRYLRNCSNVGMLGNLNVCSTLQNARHVWTIGDDDFITREGFGAVLDVLARDPACPFVFMNFGVYHRVALGDADTAEKLLAERVIIVPQPSPSGSYPVKRIAQEHDNLFTAIYPIVFRSDILAAVFNHPFIGPPFCSLVESIPTTRTILDTYPEVSARWISELAIVGNAHNSWQRHRVSWHGVLIPLALELASEAGVQDRALAEWAQVQSKLFDEARELFPDNHLFEKFNTSDFDTSLRVLRRNVAQGPAAELPAQTAVRDCGRPDGLACRAYRGGESRP